MWNLAAQTSGSPANLFTSVKTTPSHRRVCGSSPCMGLFLVKDKLPRTLLSIHLSSPSGWLGVSEALPSILGMKGSLCLAALSGQSPQPARGAPLGARD
jgi:hypothetical protein